MRHSILRVVRHLTAWAIVLMLVVPFGILSTGQDGAAAAGIQYEVIPIGTLGGAYSWAYGINDAGQVVGISYMASGEEHAFLYAGGAMTDLGTLGGSRSYAYDINDAGQVVGHSLTASGSTRAFLYHEGAMTDLGSLGGRDSQASGINAAGQVVGSSATASGPPHAFRYADGTIADLGTLGGFWSVAHDINDAGQVVGFSPPASGPQHAFLHANGTMTDLGTLGGSESGAFAINDAGQVVGYSYTANGQQHPFLYAGGTMTDLDIQGGAWGQAFDINEAGQVVGFSSISSGPLYAFLYANGTTTDLNDLLSPDSGWTITDARGINDAGLIAASGVRDGGPTQAVLLKPAAIDPGPLADRTAPTLAPVVTPNPVLLGGTATVSPNAADEAGGSGVDPAAVGCDPLDTASVGTKTVSCWARDLAGNAATAEAAYTVTYGVTLHSTATTPYKRGTTVPIGLTLRDAARTNVTVANVPVTAVELRNGTGALIRALNAPFSFTTAGSAGPGYAYGLNTKGLAAGSYMLLINVAGEVHAAPFALK